MAKVSPLLGSDAFSSGPLLTLLPVVGDISKLDSYTSAFFARFEQVQGLQGSHTAEEDVALQRKCSAESNMLRVVLDWLAVKPNS